MAAEMQTALSKVSTAWLAATLLLIGSATGCDDESKQSQEPGSRGEISRDLPTMTALEPWEPDVKIDAGLVDDLFAGYTPGPCCKVKFALREQDGEVSAFLRGSAPPLEGAGVPLSQDDGVWRATVCMPRDYAGFYYYEVYSVADGGAPVTPDMPSGQFAAQRINPSAPESTDEVVGTVNAFPPLDDCKDDSADVHSKLP